jgi:hypothetical protein
MQPVSWSTKIRVIRNRLKQNHFPKHSYQCWTDPTKVGHVQTENASCL